jgi:hypothetical protein
MTHLRSPRRLDVLIGAGVGLATLLHLAYYFPRVVDDLFISLRYADNLAHGLGAVYNPGERVEGYSGPSWMLLQSVGISFGLEGVTWTKFLGVLSLLALEAGLFGVTRFVFRVPGLLAWLPSAFCAFNSYVVNWAVLGLETPLHLASIVLGALAVHVFLSRSSQAAAVLCVLALVGLGMSRPESPMYLAVCILALLAVPRMLALVVLPALGILAALLLLRRSYYGYFVPNTYFVKGSQRSFELDKISGLWGQGASEFEAVMFVGGILLLIWFGWRQRALAPGLCALANIWFAGSIVWDWMPSLRHLLPVTVLAPIGWAVLANSVRGWRPAIASPAFASPALRSLAVAAAISPVVFSAVWVVQIDNRYSPEEKRGRSWILPKTKTKWQDTMLGYRRVEPPHVARMHHYDMGQITQAWGVLETSAAPVQDSWYAGRDIGAVGYYTGVRVFDTAGLFTPAVSQSEAWTKQRQVTDEMIDIMMERRPLAGEIYEGWERALARRPSFLAGYRLRVGTMRYPIAWIAIDRPPPSRDEIVRRYELMVSRFPRLYHLHTLYGEAVGAVAERRLRTVRGY